MSKIVKISEKTAARIRNLLTSIKESADKSEQPSSDVKAEAEKLAQHMLDTGMIRAESLEKTAEMLSTHEGALRYARHGVDLEVGHHTEKKAEEAKPQPRLGKVRQESRGEAPVTSKDRMKAASDKFEADVLGG